MKSPRKAAEAAVVRAKWQQSGYENYYLVGAGGRVIGHVDATYRTWQGYTVNDKAEYMCIGEFVTAHLAKLAVREACLASMKKGKR